MNNYQILNEQTPIEVWGKYVRLINEDDAEFITELRSDKDRTQFMLTLENDVESQKQWIREYKEREKRKEDFYFLFENESGERIGVIRGYKIDYKTKTCKGGAFIKKRGGDKNLAMAMFLFQKCFLFDVLKMETYYGEFNALNNRVRRMHEAIGSSLSPISENGFVHFELKKDNFFSELNKALKTYEINGGKKYEPLKIKL